MCFSVEKVAETAHLNGCNFLIPALSEGKGDLICPVLHHVMEWLALITVVCSCSFRGGIAVSVFRYLLLLERTEIVKQ